MLEQLWRLRRCRGGTQGLLPDFSHSIPTATFVILSSPSTLLCTNILSAQPFTLPSPHLQVAAQMSVPQRTRPPSPSTMTPGPGHSLTSPCSIFLRLLLSLCILFLTLVHHVSPQPEHDPREGRGSAYLPFLFLALSSEVEQCWPHNTCGKNHRAWASLSSGPALSSKPFPAWHP